MKRQIFIVFLLFVFIVPQAMAATYPYSDPNRQTLWNNITDGVHTLGKNPTQAQIIKNNLRNQRRQARINSINQTRSRNWHTVSN